MNRIRSIFFIVPLLILGAGCPKPAPQVLPEKLPEVTMQEFTGPSEGWPPQPKGRTNVKILSSTPIAGSLTAAFEGQIRQAALQDARVRNLLGDRFAHISTDEIEPIKDQPRVSADLPSTRVTFFSHANNVAVETYMQGTKVINVKRREGYQPHEGREEIDAAIALTQRDDRLQNVVQGLQANAILTLAQKDQPGYGHRVLYVSFWKEGEEITRYFATVDLTDQKVLAAGPAAGQSGEIERR